MTTTDFFDRAKHADAISVWLFRAVTSLSLILLLPQSQVKAVVEPMLIVATIGGVVLSAIIQVRQTEGNRALRASQLTDSLGVPLGEEPRDGYYNNLLPPSLTRLAVSTFENTLFTTDVLRRMLWKRRRATLVYSIVFFLLLAYRESNLSWLLFMAQTLFSADVILQWLRMERFYYRTSQVCQQLHQFFLQRTSTSKSLSLAFVLRTFTDYECAKDEAAMPLDKDIFNQINPTVSQSWDKLRQDLKIEGEPS
jgi:hypothetical protein